MSFAGANERYAKIGLISAGAQPIQRNQRGEWGVNVGPGRKYDCAVTCTGGVGKREEMIVNMANMIMTNGWLAALEMAAGGIMM